MLRKLQLSVLFAALFLASAAVPGALGAGQAATPQTLLEAVNATRAAHHLRPLRPDGELARAASAHTLAMVRGNYFSHGNFFGRMLAYHLRGRLGENLAWGTGSYGDAQGIVTMWLASPEHRANLLKPGYRRIGLGIAHGTFEGNPDATVVTADFGG